MLPKTRHNASVTNLEFMLLLMDCFSWRWQAIAAGSSLSQSQLHFSPVLYHSISAVPSNVRQLCPESGCVLRALHTARVHPIDWLGRRLQLLFERPLPRSPRSGSSLPKSAADAGVVTWTFAAAAAAAVRCCLCGVLPFPPNAQQKTAGARWLVGHRAGALGGGRAGSVGFGRWEAQRWGARLVQTGFDHGSVQSWFCQLDSASDALYGNGVLLAGIMVIRGFNSFVIPKQLWFAQSCAYLSPHLVLKC